MQFPAWHFCLAGGASLGDTWGQGNFLDIAKIEDPLAKNDGLEEQANQDGVLARTWTSQNVSIYFTKHALFKTCWRHVLSVAGFRRVSPYPRSPKSPALLLWEAGRTVARQKK